MAYDIIGDVHGHADRLEALLKALGYRVSNRAYRHPSRTAIFVGDLIDRGPGQLRTLRIVRAMVEAGSARCIMGNHEFNAIAWATPDPEAKGDYLRPRLGASGEKNRKQHDAFLSELACDSREHLAWTNWFLELPLWIEEPSLRVVHACWSPAHVETLRPRLRSGERLDLDTLIDASRTGSAVHEAIETVLKGAEVQLPPGCTFTDKDGHVRDAVRIRWWDPNIASLQDAYIGPKGVEIPDVPLPASARIPSPDRPTFIGHYWFDPSDDVRPASDRVACVDYSAGKGGPLVAYRFDGEPVLTADKFVAV